MPTGFDKAYYLSAKLSALQTQYVEWMLKDIVSLETFLIDSGFTAESHYSTYGYKEGLAPNACFNHDEYRFAKASQLVTANHFSSMEDALNAFDAAWPGDFYLHYLQYGAAEGLNPSNSFDENQYLADKLAILKATPSTQSQWTGKEVSDLRDFFSDIGITALDHFIKFGKSEGLSAMDVPVTEQVDPTYTPWQLPHDNVTLPSSLNLEWVDSTEITTLPHKAIGQVIVNTEDLASIGTGFLISPMHVLTSAHVLLDDTGSLDPITNITFTPGLNGSDITVSSYTWEQVWVEKNFDSNLYSEWPDDDLAIIKLNQSINNATGYLRLASGINLDLAGLSVQSSGYSVGDIEQDNPATSGQDYYQWEVSGTVDQYIFNNGALKLSGSMSVAPGASGSPVYYSQDSYIYFTGVLSGTLGDTTVAAAMDRDSYNWILGIVQQDGYYTDYTVV